MLWSRRRRLIGHTKISRSRERQLLRNAWQLERDRHGVVPAQQLTFPVPCQVCRRGMSTATSARIVPTPESLCAACLRGKTVPRSEVIERSLAERPLETFHRFFCGKIDDEATCWTWVFFPKGERGSTWCEGCGAVFEIGWPALPGWAYDDFRYYLAEAGKLGIRSALTDQRHLK